jgi:hypothetical protein
MDCTDIVIGAAIGKLSRVRDYYTGDRSTPRQDEFYGGTQSLTAAVGEETDDGMTTIIFRRLVEARESTDHPIRNEPMTVIWAHGQALGDTPIAGDFYRPDEIKYHSTHRGLANINFYAHGMTGTPSTVNTNSWSYPPGCMLANACKYRVVWSMDPSTDMITFTVTANQPSTTWTGIGFAEKPLMENMDAYIGYIDSSSNRGVVIDGWTGSRFSRPIRDTFQSTQQASVSYVSGVLTLTFKRPMDTGDRLQDLKFSDTDCYYFMFPVGGGRMTNNQELSIHLTTPMMSPNKICIGSSDWTSAASSQVYGAGHNTLSAGQRLVTYLAYIQAMLVAAVTTQLVNL